MIFWSPPKQRGSQHGYHMADTRNVCNPCRIGLDDGTWCPAATKATRQATLAGRSFTRERTATPGPRFASGTTSLPPLRPYYRRQGFRTTACADGRLDGTSIAVFQAASHLSATHSRACTCGRVRRISHLLAARELRVLKPPCGSAIVLLVERLPDAVMWSASIMTAILPPENPGPNRSRLSPAD